MGMQRGRNDDYMKKYAEESIKTSELLLSDWTRSDIYYGNMPVLEQTYGYTYESVRYGSMQCLAYSYSNFFNDIEKAVEWANRLPNIDCTKELVLSNVLKGDERIKKIRENIILYGRTLTDELKKFARWKYDNDNIDVPEEIQKFKDVIAEFEEYVKKET